MQERIPHELLNGAEDYGERVARLGRFAVLQELGYFGDETNLSLAKGDYHGTFIGRIRKHFSCIYGDVRGCDPADIEIAAEMLGVFDDIFDIEAEGGTKHIGDK